MKLQSGVLKVARQELALERRRKDVQLYVEKLRVVVKPEYEADYKEFYNRKLATAKSDVANLEKKLSHL